MAAPAPIPTHATVTVPQGTFKRLRYTVRNGTGAALDLSAAESLIWYLLDNEAEIAVKTVGDGLSVASPETDGVVLVEITPDDSAGYTPGTYEARLRIAVDAAEPQVVGKGPIEITPMPAVE